MVVKSERTGERPEAVEIAGTDVWLRRGIAEGCLLYTSDAADDHLAV